MQQQGQPWQHTAQTLLTLLASTGPIFGGFLYYVGRRYTDGYYQALGVPTTGLQFSFTDYLYQGIQSGMFTVALVVTALVVILFRLYQDREATNLTNEKPGLQGWLKVFRITILPRRDEPPLLFLWLLLYVAFVGTGLFAFTSYSEGWNDAAKSFMGIFLPAFTAGLVIVLMTNSAFREFVVNWRPIYIAFCISVGIAIFVTIQLLPNAAGAFFGIRHVRLADKVFPQVQLISGEQISPFQLRWKPQETGHFISTDRLLLVLRNDDQLFLLQPEKSPDSFSISANAILEVEIQIPGRFLGGAANR